jgi:hypothetical protein
VSSHYLAIQIFEVPDYPFFGKTTRFFFGIIRQFSVDNRVTLAVDTRHRLAEPGETETLEASLTRWKEDLS